MADVCIHAGTQRVNISHMAGQKGEGGEGGKEAEEEEVESKTR